jgi:hypothetical protein
MVDTFFRRLVWSFLPNTLLLKAGSLIGYDTENDARKVENRIFQL